MSSYDAVVVGAGPNGLAAAVEIARNQRSVLVLEAAESIGGGARTAELTLPGYRHDVCSSIHPMGIASPYFRTLPLDEYGLEWIHPTLPLAHPLDDGSAAVLDRSVDVSAETLGEDAAAYRKLMEPLVRNAEALTYGFLGPVVRIPRNPFVMLRLGLYAMRPAASLARSVFTGERARALLAGNAAHTLVPLETRPTGAVGLVFQLLGHASGWPLPRGGSQAIVDALARYLWSIGGRIQTGSRITAFRELPPARVYLFDLSPRQLVEIAGDQLSAGYRQRISRFRYGAGVFKIDWALDGPIPWKAAACAGAGTVHCGGTLEEIAAGEAAVARGEHPQRPWVIVAQQSLFDDSRAPAGKHTGWAYCHVPNGSTLDMTDVIESQMERFAPGFRDLVLARSVRTAVDIEAYNGNYVGGDIAAGQADLRQIIGRPTLRLSPYTTPHPGIYLCSSSTPPGPGVHGMSGYYAARAALRRLR
ncbi:MAG TPA: NAD(P)/FAD-dependent oxidoreductase [Actinomycetota bacterium]|nr:NAD(P)/FAD-dependent oxidoreductase [Actinomycetota bacterium]